MCCNKKQNAQKKNYMLAVAFLSLFLIPHFANATIQVSQPVTDGAEFNSAQVRHGFKFTVDNDFTLKAINILGDLEANGTPVFLNVDDKFLCLDNTFQFSCGTYFQFTDLVQHSSTSTLYATSTGSAVLTAGEYIVHVTASPSNRQWIGTSFDVATGTAFGRVQIIGDFSSFLEKPADLGDVTFAICDDVICALSTTTVSGQITTVLDIIEPTAGTTTATTTVNVIVDLFNDNGEADVLTLFVDDRVTSQQVPIFPFDFSITSGFVTKDIDIVLPTGSFTLRAVLFNTVTGSQHGNVKRVDFNVINDEFTEVFGADITDVDDLLNLATTTCSITNLSGCFQNALVFAFVPAESSFDRFITLKDQLVNKPPFGYFALLASGLSGLNSTSTPAFALATEDNIVTTIFDPIKTGLSWLLWVFFGVWLYKRVIAIAL